ncbi:MAG TPA: hypothetical protein VGR06_32830, partial [Actinophytocola sp.]|uniref:hypothetical protein n=1 Tax=Actinophytocola sp. TaxID=1872138 RepID=UPI002E0C1D1C|nr:hypothetical protein [Actinophytocola sp.]
HELMRESHEPVNIELLTRVADLVPGTASAADMRKWHDELVTWAAGREQMAAGRLGLELAAWLLFAATVVEFFDPAEVATRMGEAESPEAGAKGLELLATARQSLAVSPGLALAYLKRFREAWGLAGG